MDTKEETTLETQALSPTSGSPEKAGLHGTAKEKPLIRCPICGSRMWRNNFLRHAKTKKHQDALYVLHERCEMKQCILTIMDHTKETLYARKSEKTFN